jgi:signal transduction histidine kinase
VRRSGKGVRRPLFFAPPPSSRPGASVGEAIHEAFAIRGSPAQRFVVGRLGAMVGSILGIGIAVSLTLSDATAIQRIGAGTACVAGIVAGQVLLRLNVSILVLDITLFVADVILAAAGAEGGPLYTLLPAVFVALGMAVFVIRPLHSSVRHLALIGGSYAYVLAAGPPASAPLTRWVAVMAAVLISGLFARWLVGRVTDLANAEHAARLEVERSTRELEGQSELKTAFLARMSHELRTPLNVVVGFADVLRDGLAGPLTERQQGYVEDIAGSGRDLLLLVDELLDVTKVETGALELDLTRVDIAEAVADAELLVQGRARESGVTVSVSRPQGPVVADADALRIRQIAWNLVGNAVKFTPRGGTVHVTVAAGEDWVRVEVRDNGPGIDAEDQDRIFEPYEQGQHREGGSGIGLALSRRLIEAHGGRLHLDSTPGSGSTFSFALPRHRPAATADDAATVLDPEPKAWTELEQAILVPGSVANRTAVAEIGRFFSNSSAILLPILAVITPGPVVLRLVVILVAGAAFLMSYVLGKRGHGLPARSIDVLGGFGTVAVSIGVLVAGPFASLVALAYGWNALVSSALLPAGEALAQISLGPAAYAIVLLISAPDGALVDWIAVTMLISANTAVVGWVSGRLREVMSEALSARLAAEATRSQVEAVSAHKSDFLANTSHELCTPLNAIIGFAQVLRDELAGPLEPKQESYLDDILESGQHLLALITDLLDLAKLEAGRLPSSPQPLSIASLIDTAAGAVVPAADRRNIDVVVEAAPDLPTIAADAGHLYHAIANLLANAVKFTSDGGRVEVRASHVGDHVTVSVSDTGIGILPEQLPHLFEAFHQGSRPVPVHARGGTGLGLTLAKSLVELEGGRITLESTPNVGSTFTIVLASHVADESISTGAMA